MTVRARLALAALLALAPRGAAAQWRATPMVVPGAAGAEVLVGRFSAGATGDELLVVDRATGAGRLRAHRALLSTTAWPHALPRDTPLAAGRTRDANADPLADVAYGQGTNLVIRYGASPATAIPRAGLAPGRTSYVHALAHDGDVVAYPTAGIAAGVGSLVFWDFATSAFGGTGTRTSWPANGLGPIAGAEHEVLGIRLSPAAAPLGLDDLAMPTGGGVFLLAHAPPTADARYASPPLDPAELRLAEVRVGGPSALPRPPWLPASLPRKGDALGAAALDVDGDGGRDLVFSYGSHLPIAGGGFPGRLVAIRGTGDVRQLASGTWEDLTAHPDLQLGDPAVLRPVVIGGQPAAALWDRGRDEIVVVFPGADAGRLAAWRGDAAGREVRDIRTADVVGSTAPDLVVVADDLLVYPDLGDASPALAWSGGSPPVPLRGQDLLLSASAADPDGACTVEWLVGPPGDAAVVTSASVPGPAAQELAYQVPGAALCAPQTLSATVRATDALGVFDELSLSFEVAPTPLTLRIAGADRPGRLVLEPGGITTVAFVATAATGCGDVAWGGVA